MKRLPNVGPVLGKDELVTKTDGAPDVTGLLRAWSAGDNAAGERVIAAVYAELRRQAGRYLRRERRDHTLRPTALVHEAYLRLAWSTRMRRIMEAATAKNCARLAQASCWAARRR